MSHIAILVLVLKRPSTLTASSSAIPHSQTLSRSISSKVSPQTLAHRASRCDTKETSASVATATPELAQGTTACIFRSGEDMSGSTCIAKAKREQLGVGGGWGVGAEGRSGDTAF